MSLPARNTLAIVGAGPVGLEAACAALDHGFDVHVFERGEVGANVQAWGHVRMFTPWSMNVGPCSAARLRAAGRDAPAGESCPTGADLADQVLIPLAALPELKDRVHTHAQVVHVSRRGALKGDLVGDPRRREHPFRLLVRDAGGRENVLHAFAVIDASGTYGSPNWAGDGGIPARGEEYLAPQMSYHVEDVRGLARARHAGKRTLVVGGGASAATTVVALAELASEVPGTAVTWAMREGEPRFAGEVEPDSLPARAALYARARELATTTGTPVTWIGGAVVEGFEYNSATHRFRVALRIGEQARLEEADRVVVNAGFGPDNSLYRELQVHECWASRGPMKLSAALLGAAGADCTAMPVLGVDQLGNPEPDFYVLGAKSYARSNSFLLRTGYTQVRQAIEALAAGVSSAAR